MMTTRIRFVLVAGVIAVAAAAAVPVLMAQDGQGPDRGPGLGGPPPRGGMGPRGPMGQGGPMAPLGGLGRRLRALGLSDEQREQVRKTLDSHKGEFTPIGERMRTARAGMRALTEADTVDAEAIRAKSLELAAAEADAAILGAKVRSEIFAVLTPEQRQKAKEMRTAMDRPERRFRPMGPRRGGWR